MKKSLFIGLAAAMLLALPVMAEDAVTRSTPITPEDLVSDVTDKAATEKWTWDVDTKTLVLKNGFVMDVYDDYDDGITVPEGTTIVVEGKAKINVYEDAIDVEDMLFDEPAEAAFNEETWQPLKILLRANADLTLYAGSDGIVTNIMMDDGSYYTDLIITGENRTTSKLTVYNDSGDEGIQGDAITIDTCTVKIHVDEECVDADHDVIIRNSIVDVKSEEEEGIYTADGNVIIENSDITVYCEEDCIDAYYSVAITDSSLDLTLTSDYAIMDVASKYYAEGIRIDRTFNLYDADGNQLNDAPVEYSADLINFEEDEAWYWQDQQVFRLVTTNEVIDETDTTASITNVFRSLRTVSFSGEGTSALKELCRAFGSTVNLNKFVPAAREGYTFTGWYADAACTKPITRLVVTGDMEIYAGWEPIVVEEETEVEEENN